MSNRQFSLTIKAIEIIESIPKRTRSKFVSDAVIYLSKKKGIFDEYLFHKSEDKLKSKTPINHSSDKKDSNKKPIKKKVKIDQDF